ncbi:MAG: hypothetical protein JW751_18040 [Polyangiaceae bacterium]|nr:hypothetical protein [Polyangiaceae bacterium]
MRRFALGLAAALALNVSVVAAGRPLPADALDPKKVRIDGVLKEWPAGAIKLNEKVQGSSSARVTAFIGYDDSSLYLALDARDTSFVRTSAFGKGEDHAVFTIAVPSRAGGSQRYELGLFAGQPGKSAGQVKLGGSRISGATVVEAPNATGYTVEAKIPWSALPAAAKVRVGLRGTVKYVDASQSGRIAGVLASGDESPIFITAEQSLYENLIDPKGLDLKPGREAYGNVAGDGMLERVAVYGGYLVIVGPHYQKGTSFYFKDLVVPDPSYVRRLEVRDMNGDGTDEIVIQLRTGKDTYREILEILEVQKNGAAERVFTHEVAIVTDEGRIQNEVKLGGTGTGATITISQGTDDGFTKDRFREPPHEGMASALLPWDTVKSRTIGWDGSAYAVKKETEQKPRALGAGGKVEKGAPGGVPSPPPPRPPSADELMDKVYALYRKERGLGHSKPRFDFVTDVAGSSELERVLVHDKEVLVFGKEFLGGASYTYIAIGVKSGADVLDVTARDLTGDGKAEVIVRGLLHAKGGEELEDEEVNRQVLFVYQVKDSGISRIFGAELGRVMGDHRILGALSFAPAARGFDLVLHPGRAVGWTQKNYPFSEESGPNNGLEPLMLPWSRGIRRYTFSGTAYLLQ